MGGTIIPASNEPSAVLARAFGECREGRMPRQLAAGYLTETESEKWMRQGMQQGM